jgi:hypothetical protein
MTMYELLMLISAVVTAIGGGFVVLMVQTYKWQMNAQVFTECNSRYDDILTAFPESARKVRLALDTALPGPSAELTMGVLRYLNLRSEVFYLYYRRGYLQRDGWNVWEGELWRTLRSPLLKALGAEEAVRTSFMFYNTRAEVEALASALEKITRGTG